MQHLYVNSVCFNAKIKGLWHIIHEKPPPLDEISCTRTYVWRVANSLTTCEGSRSAVLKTDLSWNLNVLYTICYYFAILLTPFVWLEYWEVAAMMCNDGYILIPGFKWTTTSNAHLLPKKLDLMLSFCRHMCHSHHMIGALFDLYNLQLCGRGDFK